MGALQHRNGLLNLSGESLIGKKCNAWTEKKSQTLAKLCHLRLDINRDRYTDFE